MTTAPDKPSAGASSTSRTSRTSRGSTARSAALVTAGIFLSRIFGLLRQRVVAHYFGTSPFADVLAAAFRVGNITQNLLGEGTLSASFIPVYAKLRGEGKGREAVHFALASLGLLIVAVAIVSLIGILAAPWLTWLIAAGFDEQKLGSTAGIVRIVFPMTGLLVLSAWGLGVLNAHRRFFLPYAAPVVWSLAQIAGLVLAGSFLSMRGQPLAHALAWSALAGAGLQLLLLLPAARSRLGSLRPRLDTKDAAVREATARLPAAIAGRGIIQISGLVDNLLVSFLGTGAIAVFGYAQTIYLLPMSLLGTGEAAAALPEMARDTADQDLDRRNAALRSRLGASLARITTLTLPAMAAFGLLGRELITLFFQGGSFVRSDTARVEPILAAYGLALLGNASGRVFGTTCFALGDTKTPARYALVRVLVSTALALALMSSLGVLGVVLGAVTAGWVEAIALGLRVRKAIGGLGLEQVRIVRILALAGVSVGAGLGARAGLGATAARMTEGILGSIAVLAAFGVAFLIAARVLKLFSLRSLTRRASRPSRPPPRAPRTWPTQKNSAMRRPMTTARLSRSARSIGLLAGLTLGAVALSPGCKSSSGGIGLSKEQQGDDAFADVPSPPADGPKLVALREGTPILDRPRPDAKTIGELRLGAAIARSAEPYSRSGCDEGWYAVRPRGFVCLGKIATLAESAADVLPAGPDLTRPLPYRFGRAKFESVQTYSRMPTLAEQTASEPDLSRHLPRSQGDGDPLGAAANDVPLDPRGVPTGPPVILPGGDGVDANSRRTTASFFTFASGERIPPLVPLSVLRGEAPAPAPLRRGSGVAVTGVFSADGGAAMRRFGLLTDGRVVPIDRLKPALGSTWHGIDLEKAGLPVGFVHKRGVTTYALSRGKAEAQDEELDRRTGVPLTGRFRTVDGVRYEQAKEGFWLRSQDLIVVVRRSKLPEFAKGAQKWLDVSLANQTLTAYEGSKPVFATLISSGRDQLKDPAVSASTVRGTFRIKSKHVTRALDSREVHGEFDVADAPWVMEFEPGYALHGMYWSDGVGEAHGFHNIGLTPIDARRIFMWSDPEVPEGWHGAFDAGETSTIVLVRP